MTTMQYIWLALVVVFVVLEAGTAVLVCIWFCAGALAALLVSFFAPAAIAAQIAVFLIVSTLFVLLLRPMAKRLLDNRRVATNADASIGKLCQVVSEVQPGRFGRAKLEGLEWTIKADTVLPVGSWCRVVAIEGVKLVVVPAPEGPAAKQKEDAV